MSSSHPYHQSVHSSLFFSLLLPPPSPIAPSLRFFIPHSLSLPTPIHISLRPHSCFPTPSASCLTFTSQRGREGRLQPRLSGGGDGTEVQPLNALQHTVRLARVGAAPPTDTAVAPFSIRVRGGHSDVHCKPTRRERVRRGGMGHGVCVWLWVRVCVGVCLDVGVWCGFLCVCECRCVSVGVAFMHMQTMCMCMCMYRCIYMYVCVYMCNCVPMCPGVGARDSCARVAIW